MVYLEVGFQELVIKGSSTPVFVPDTVEFDEELPLVLVRPGGRKKLHDPGWMSFGDTITQAAEMLAITRGAAKLRLYRAIDAGLLFDNGRKGPERMLRTDAFYEWLRRETERMDDDDELDHNEIDARIRAVRREKQARRSA